MRPQWPSPPDEALQANWGARWIAMAMAKPFVRSGLLDADQRLPPPPLPPRRPLPGRPDPKPLYSWFKSFRTELLA